MNYSWELLACICNLQQNHFKLILTYAFKWLPKKVEERVVELYKNFNKRKYEIRNIDV